MYDYLKPWNYTFRVAERIADDGRVFVERVEYPGFVKALGEQMVKDA